MNIEEIQSATTRELLVYCAGGAGFVNDDDSHAAMREIIERLAPYIDVADAARTGQPTPYVPTSAAATERAVVAVVASIEAATQSCDPDMLRAASDALRALRGM